MVADRFSVIFVSQTILLFLFISSTINNLFGFLLSWLYIKTRMRTNRMLG